MNTNSRSYRPWFVLLVAVAVLVVGQGCGGGGGKSGPTAPMGGTGGNHAPVLNVSADSTRMFDGNLCTVRVMASDPDGDQLTFGYVAAGGSVSSSGPSATTATFTAGRSGNDSVTVTASDGRGGTTRATALIYVVPPAPPSLIGIKMTCSWSGVPPESLIVLSGWAGGTSGIHDIDVNGLPTPQLITPGNTQTIGSVDPCTATLTVFHVLVQRPLPDGRVYDVQLR